MSLKRIFLYLSVLVSIALLACNPQTGAWKSSDKTKVVTTTTMLHDLVSIIGGDQTEVLGLMDHKIDPHGYEQSFNDTQAINSADLIIYNGLHLEAKMQKALEAKAKKGDAVYAVGDYIPAAQLLNDAGERDPHIWGDPQLWIKTIDPVLEGLIRVDPGNEKYYTANAEAYRKELNQLHQWAKKRVEEIPHGQRTLVTSHDAFQYFAKAYDFQVRGLQGLSSAEEVGTNAASQLISYIKENRIKTIFAESVTNKKGVQVVAKEAGVKLSEEPLYADTCGPRGEIKEVHGESYDVGSYIGMIKHNVNTVVEALK